MFTSINEFKRHLSISENHMDFSEPQSSSSESLINQIIKVEEYIDENDFDGAIIGKLNQIMDKFCGPYDTKYDGHPLRDRLEDTTLSVDQLTSLLSELNGLKNELPNNDVQLDSALNKQLYNTLVTYIKLSDAELINLQKQAIAKLPSSTPEFEERMNADFQDPEYVKRLINELRSDTRYAIDNLEQFHEFILPVIQKVLSNNISLAEAIAAYANGSDDIESWITEGKTYKNINESINNIPENKLPTDYLAKINQLKQTHKIKVISYTEDFRKGSYVAHVQSFDVLVGNWTAGTCLSQEDAEYLQRAHLDADIKSANSKVTIITSETLLFQRDVDKLLPLTGGRINESSESLTSKPVALYVLATKSKINTKNPLANEFVSNSSQYETCFVLVKTQYNPNGIIISGSGKSEFYTSASDIFVFDDGNKTTRYPQSYERYYDRAAKQMKTRHKSVYAGIPAEIIATANNIEEIKKFPAGNYNLVVLK